VTGIIKDCKIAIISRFNGSIGKIEGFKIGCNPEISILAKDSKKGTV